jgi:MFS family permease
MTTVIYAIFACGTIVTLQRDNSIATRVGRRGMMLGAVGTIMAAAGLLAARRDLPGLLIGCLLTGVSVGLAAGTAITYLIELRLRADPNVLAGRARTIGTSVNVGALGVGPLIAGCRGQWVNQPLPVSYLLFVGLGAVALTVLRAAPEAGASASRCRETLVPRSRF